MTDEQAAAYLAGMIDGEGHVGLHIYEKNRGSKRSVTHRRLTITNTDHDLIAATVRCFQRLGIKCWVTTVCHRNSNRAPCMAVNVSYREGFEQIRELVPIQSERKLEALDAILASYKGTRRSSGFRGLSPLPEL